MARAKPGRTSKAEEAILFGAPRPKPLAPKCPKWLSGEARREWRRVVPALEKLGLLSELDGAALEAYVSTYGRMVRAERDIAENGSTYITSTGFERVRPAVKIATEAEESVRRFCAEFGLTPSARSRMAIPNADDTDEMDHFLSEIGR